MFTVSRANLGQKPREIQWNNNTMVGPATGELHVFAASTDQVNDDFGDKIKEVYSPGWPSPTDSDVKRKVSGSPFSS